MYEFRQICEIANGDSPTWLTSLAGGEELARKVFNLRVWPAFRDLLVPFCNAVREAVDIPPIEDVALSDEPYSAPFGRASDCCGRACIARKKRRSQIADGYDVETGEPMIGTTGRYPLVSLNGHTAVNTLNLGLGRPGNVNLAAELVVSWRIRRAIAGSWMRS